MNSGEYECVVFVDLKKAYDMVDRQILLTAVESRLTHRNPNLDVLQQLLKPSRILMAGDLNLGFKSNRGVPQGS